MTQPSDHVSWWIISLPALLLSTLMFIMMWITVRKRRWRDRTWLGKAATMPLELVLNQPKTVKDMVAGDEGFVPTYAVVTSQKGRRTFVRWDATLSDVPEDPFALFAPLRIRRLERGFSLTVRQGDRFGTSPLPWGSYAPVTEIIQVSPGSVSGSVKSFV